MKTVRLLPLLFTFYFLTSTVLIIYGEQALDNILEDNYIQSSWSGSLFFINFIDGDYFFEDQLNFHLHTENQSNSLDIVSGYRNMNGLYELSGFETILEDSEDKIASKYSEDCAEIRLSLPNLTAWGSLYDRMPGGGIIANSPELYGFSIEAVAERNRFGGSIDLLKKFDLDYSFIKESYQGRLIWQNTFLEIVAGYTFDIPEIISYPENTETGVIISLEGNSDYKINGGFNLKLNESWHLSGSLDFSQYSLLTTGGVDNLRFMEIYNSANAGEKITFNLQQYELFMEVDNFKIGGFYHHAALPCLDENKAYIEATPILPAGLLFRRRDILVSFGGSADFAGLWVEQILNAGGVLIEWNLTVSMLKWLFSGTYYNIEGAASFPFLIWNMTKSPEETIAENGMLLFCIPELSCSFPIGDNYLTINASQILPLYFNSVLFSGDEYEDTLTDIWGGTSASLFFTLKL